MDSSRAFSLFPNLPAELRLQIYSHALPCRTLQIGYDFPFPFLPLPRDASDVDYPTDQPDRCLHPTPVVLPSLFHACHESRQLCLSAYLPFAYTYAHPHKDALYISSLAGAMLSHNMNWYYKCARPPTYPLAEMDKVAVELSWGDLPLQGRQIGGWLVSNNRSYLYSSPLMESYLAAFAEFGMPKEVLVVSEKPEASRERPTQMKGWNSIRFVGDPNVSEPYKSVAVLQHFHDNLYHRKEGTPWFCGKLPDVKIVGVEKERASVMQDHESPSLWILGDQTARLWQRTEYSIHGRQWNFDMDGSPYVKERMEKALERARVGTLVSD